MMRELNVADPTMASAPTPPSNQNVLTRLIASSGAAAAPAMMVAPITSEPTLIPKQKIHVSSLEIILLVIGLFFMVVLI